ncbi:MAG: hypothetical protein KDE35_18440 [Geminicoccaceae bacterium]|nr:hypothetical protein [Geminicoccaceae bacterium]
MSACAWAGVSPAGPHLGELVEDDVVEIGAAQGIGPFGAGDEKAAVARQVDRQILVVDPAAGDRPGVFLQIMPGIALGLVAEGGDIGHPRRRAIAAKQPVEPVHDAEDGLAETAVRHQHGEALERACASIWNGRGR